MLCRTLCSLPFIGFVIGTILLPAAARAAFEVVAHDAAVDATNRETTFTLTFNAPPDFVTTNDSGQPANAFQIFYDAEISDDDADVGFAGEDVVIVRGPEIRFDNTIPIRDSLNPSGEEFLNAEGWGATLGAVDFTLEGATLSFRTSWDLLRETDEHFGYRLYGLEQGELTSEFIFLTHILVPLPPPVLGAAGLLLVARLLAQKRI